VHAAPRSDEFVEPSLANAWEKLVESVTDGAEAVTFVVIGVKVVHLWLNQSIENAG